MAFKKISFNKGLRVSERQGRLLAKTTITLRALHSMPGRRFRLRISLSYGVISHLLEVTIKLEISEQSRVIHIYVLMSGNNIAETYVGDVRIVSSDVGSVYACKQKGSPAMSRESATYPRVSIDKLCNSLWLADIMCILPLLTYCYIREWMHSVDG